MDNQLKAIIAEDEILARDLIRNYLRDYPMIRVIAECDNGLSALNEINRLQPDLVFLDIQMPELDGISILTEMTVFPKVIFTTAYNQYAVKAFELNAVDYLLKPFGKDRFDQAIGKVLKQTDVPSRWNARIEALKVSMNSVTENDKTRIDRILIKGKSGHSFLDVRDIIWIGAYGDYVKIYTSDKMHLKNISLNEMESRLDPQQFTRVHRSSIVNLTCIKELKPYTNGEYFIKLTNGVSLKLSRSYKEKITVILNESI